MLRTWTAWSVVAVAAILMVGALPLAADEAAPEGLLYEGDPGGETDEAVDFAVIETLDDGALEGDPIANAGSEERGKKIGELIKKHDADGDGKLSDTEKQSALEGMKEARVAFLKKRLTRKADADGDGQLTDAEKAALEDHVAKAKARAEEVRGKIKARFDANADGSLDNGEKQALREAFMKRKGRAGGPGDRMNKGGRKGKRGDHPKGEHPKGDHPKDKGGDAPEEGGSGDEGGM